jgi:hypothetical protein
MILSQCRGMGPAVVLSQRRARIAGLVRHCASADLAAHDRKVRDGDWKTGGAGVRHPTMMQPPPQASPSASARPARSALPNACHRGMTVRT